MGDGLGFGVREGEGVGVGATALITTPLFHTSLFLLLMQVNCLPLKFLVSPALLQIAPALGGVAEIDGARGAKSRRAIRMALSFMERNDKLSSGKL